MVHHCLSVMLSTGFSLAFDSSYFWLVPVSNGEVWDCYSSFFTGHMISCCLASQLYESTEGITIMKVK